MMVEIVLTTSWEQNAFSEAWASENYALYVRYCGGMLTKVDDMIWHALLLKRVRL